MKYIAYIAYISFAAAIVAIVGFAINPYGTFGRLTSTLTTEADYANLLFQISSWVALTGGVVVFLWNLRGDKKLKIIRAIAAVIPLAIFIFRYRILPMCFLPGASDRECL